MVVAKKYVIVKHFEGEPQSSDLRVLEEELPAIVDGEIMVAAEFLSVDPYMRKFSTLQPIGATMVGSQVAKIIESKDPNYPVGGRIVGYLGWRSHTVLNMNKLSSEYLFNGRRPYLLPDIGNLPASTALGVLGMPGMTAYYGFFEICHPKPGETVVITGAAGAVGSHVGQLAKIAGLKVIGIAGSDAKCRWLTNELGFDHAINYKTQDVAEELKKAAPEGIDCFFDNVGGEIASTIIFQMNEGGRVSVCGSISSYNANPNEIPKCSPIQPAINARHLKIEGFIVSRWLDLLPVGIKRNLEFIKQGKLKFTETITEGFDRMFEAFSGLFRGMNTGKAIVKA